MRLIDVDDLGVGRCSKDVLPAAYCAGWNGLLGLIEKAPTADAALVVRCEDCLYWVSAVFPAKFLHIQVYFIILFIFWQALSCRFSAFQVEKSEMSVNNHLLHILT